MEGRRILFWHGAPARPLWGKDPAAGAVSADPPASLHAGGRPLPRPDRTPERVPARARAPAAPRAVLTSGAEPQAGPASPGCHTRHGEAAKAAEKEETPAAAA